MYKIKHYILSLLLLCSSYCYSQLTVKNNTKVPIAFCIGWNEDNGSWAGLETKGWFTLYPGQSIEPGLYFTAADAYFFFYVRTLEAVPKEVTSGTKLLVHPTDAFDIKNCDMEYVKTQNPVYQWKPFKRKDLHFKKRQRAYTFEITMSDIIDAL